MDCAGFHEAGGIAHMEEAKCTFGQRKKKNGNDDSGREAGKPEAPAGSGSRFRSGVGHD